VASPYNLIGGGTAMERIGGAFLAGAGSQFLGDELEDYGTTAQNVGRFVGGLAGGSAAGLPKRAIAGRASKAANAAMTGEEGIHNAGTAGYDFINNNNINVDHNVNQDLVDTIRDKLRRRGLSPITAGQTHQLLDRLENAGFMEAEHPDTGRVTKQPVPAKLSEMLETHTELHNVDRGTADGTAARMARDEIIGWIDKNSGARIPKVLKTAMGNWSAYKKMEELRKAHERAEIRTESYGTGQNFQNYMRDEIKKIIDPRFPERAKGYKPNEIEAMKNFVAGSVARNITRVVGKGLSPASPLGFIRAATESLLSMPLAIATSGTGLGAHLVGDFLTRKELEDIIRMVQARAPVNAVTGPKAVAAGQRVRQAQSNLHSAALRGAIAPPSQEDVLDNPSGIPLQ
jgi:hypothetical protein